jgi:glucose/arabinose dehydrogenase
MMLRRLAAALAAVVLGSSLLPLDAPPPARAADSLPPGFVEATFASGFGNRLTAMAWSPDGRLFVSEKTGALRVVKNGTLLSQPFLTVPVNTSGERGLLGVTFDPNFATNRHVYVIYTHGTNISNRVSRFTASSSNPDVAQGSSEVVILDNIPAPSNIHHGGALHFGPDGKLYISTGDAASSSNSQNLNNLNGKILRVNADGTIPTDNPFHGQANRRWEIWAYGLRNPYTFAFQEGTGRMFINDVGNATWEEINEGAAGANYGWPTCEGPCSDPSFVNPIHAYRHDEGPGKAIVGAAFYSGDRFPAVYSSSYFFGDYVGHYIKRYDVATGQVHDFATGVRWVADLRFGPDGALYWLSVESRTIGRIDFTDSAPPPPPDGDQVTLVPMADAHTSAQFPDANYGASSTLYVRNANPANVSYLKWNLSALAGRTVTAASFRMRVTTSSSAGSAATQALRLVESSSWTEMGITHNNRPSSSTQLGSIGATVPNNTYTASLTVVPIQERLGGQFSMAVEGGLPNDGMYFHSRESTTATPELILTLGTDEPPPVGEPPVPTISQPPEGTTYRAGDEIQFAGSATDAEDGALGPDALTWEILFHHDDHTHPFVEPVNGISEGSFEIPDIGETSDNVWYRIYLRAADSDGNVTEVTRDVMPLKADVTLQTDPSGLTLLLDGAPVVTPHEFTGVQRILRELEAPQSQSHGGRTYEFVEWSDGAERAHVYTTPDESTTMTAFYEEVPSDTEVIAADSFGRNVNNGWGSADTGGAYSLEGTAANFSVTAGAGRIVLPSAGANRAAYLTAASATDVDISFRVRTDKLPSAGHQLYAYGVVRRNANNAYRPKLIINSNGSVAVHAGVVVNNSESSIAPAVTVPGLSYSAGEWLWLRSEVTGMSPTTIRVRAWADGQPEPDTWHYTATNSTSAVQTAGAVGLRAYVSSSLANAPVTFDFDDLAATAPVGSPPPPPPPSSTIAADTFSRTVSNGWGSANTGGAYTLEGTASNFSVANGVGSMLLPSSGATRAVLLSSTSAQGVDMTFRVRADKLPSGGQLYAYGVVRRNANNAYRPKLIINANGSVQVHAGVVVNNAESSIAPAVTVPGLSYSPNSWLWLRTQVSGTNPTTIRIRVWADGGPEPSTWHYSATNSTTQLQSAGAVGLRAYISSGLTNAPVTFGFDDYSVTAP